MRHGKIDAPMSGHQLPRHAMAGAAATPPTPDTKPDGRRGGSGPKVQCSKTCAPFSHVGDGDKPAPVRIVLDTEGPTEGETNTVGPFLTEPVTYCLLAPVKLPIGGPLDVSM